MSGESSGQTARRRRRQCAQYLCVCVPFPTVLCHGVRLWAPGAMESLSAPEDPQRLALWTWLHCRAENQGQSKRLGSRTVACRRGAGALLGIRFDDT